MNKKPIYTTFSFYEFLRVIFFGAIFIIGFFVLLSVYDENPAVILVLMIIDVLFIFFMGYKQISLYEDRVVMINLSIFSSIFNSKGSVYYFKDIKAAEFPPPASNDEVAATAVIGAFLRMVSKRRNAVSDDDQLSFYLEMKDGNSISVYTRFENYKIKRIVELINSQIEKE